MVESMMELVSKLSPVTVMFRGTLESIFSDERLNGVFASHAQRQYCRELTFADAARLMVQVVARIRPSINAAYRAEAKAIPVSAAAVYQKLNGTEPAVCEGLVRETSRATAAVIDELHGSVAGPVPGYDVRILDGNHLAGTEHRLAELRGHGAAALPGHTLAVLDPQRRLIEDVVVCEDAHTNQRLLIPRVLERVEAGQCWIGDSHFCTRGFLLGVHRRDAGFVVRQHQQLQGELLGRRRAAGRCPTGKLYEQRLRITADDGEVLELRRITIELDRPTQTGQTQIHLLTNLPPRVRAHRVAQSYRDRWQIETAFQEVTVNLRCEIDTLGYPGAALLGFCVALVLYNALAVVKAAIRRGTPGAKDAPRNLSMYALADEIAGLWRGLEIVPAAQWHQAFHQRTARQLARQLRVLAKDVDLCRFTTCAWTPQHDRPPPTSGNRGNHRATARLIEKRKSHSQSP